MNAQVSANSASLYSPPRVAELVMAGLLLAAVFLAQVAITRSSILFHHTFWLDEILTWVLVNDPSLAHAMSALHGGVDTNPPTMYLILWPLAKLVGGLNESGLHIVSFISAIVALVGLFAMCRRHFNPLASFIGVMTVAAHPLIVHHAFDARFYMPWLAATVWYALAIARLRDAPSNGRLIVACILAALAATVHYYGIIGVALISAADLLMDRAPLRDRLRRAIPPAVGLAATCACIPFVLGQREGLHVRTWIEPATFSELRTLLTALFGAPPVLLIVLGAWILRLVRSSPAHSGVFRDFIPMTSLLIFPFIIIVISVLVQPSVQDRYFIVAVAPLSALAAHLMSAKPRWFAGAIMLGLFVLGTIEVASNAKSLRGADRDMGQVIASIHSLPDSQQVIFKRRVEMYPLLRVAPELLMRSSLLDFDPNRDADVRPFSVFERDMARKFEQYYPSFKSVRLRDLSPTDSIFVIVPPDSAERYEVKLLFGNRRIEPRDQWMGEVMPR